MLASWVWRDDRHNPAFCEPIAQARCIVGAIGEEPPGQANCRQELSGTGKIVAVAGRNHERQRPPKIVGQRVDFGRAPTTRAADGMMEGPPFAPVAERWTLMCVLSIDIVPTMPVEPVRA